MAKTTPTPAPFDWDQYLAGASAPVQSATGASPSYDWDQHLAGTPAPADQPTAGPAPQDNSWLRYPKLGANALAGGLNVMLGATGSMRDATLTPAETGPSWSPINRYPSVADFEQVTNALGLTNRPEAQPQNAPERYGSALVSAIPEMAATVASGGTLLPSVLAAGGGATAGQAVHDLFPNSKWGPAVAGVLTGLTVGGVSGAFGRSAAAKQAALDYAAAQARLKAAGDAKFTGDFSARTAAGELKAASKEKLAAAGKLAGATVEAGQAHADEVFNGTAASLGDSSTYQQAGEKLQEHAQNWLDGPMQEQLGQLRAPLDAKIPTDLTGPLDSFQAAIKKNTNSAGALESLAALMKPKLSAQLGAKLNAGAELDQLGIDGPEVAPAREYSWADMSALRSTLGDAMVDPKILPDLGAKNASRLYAGLTMDMRVLADKAGAVGDFDKFNEGATALYDLAGGPIARVLSGKPGDVVSSLVSGAKRDTTDLAALRQTIPDGVNEVAAAHLRQGGTKGWAKLVEKNPAAGQVLIPDPEAQTGLAGALGVKAAAVENSRTMLEQAEADHAETAAAAQEALRTGSFERAKAVRQAQDAVAAAKAGIPPPPSPLTNVAHSVQSGVGMVLGDHFAPTIMNHLGLTGPLASAGITAAGLALPMAARGVKNLVVNPGSVRYPVAAGLAASNPLALEPAKPQE